MGGEHVTFEAPKRKRRRRSKGHTIAKQADKLLQDSVDFLEDLLDSCNQTLHAGRVSPALVRESANIARSVMAVSGEIRQLEKHKRLLDESIPDDELVELMILRASELPLEKRRALETAVVNLNAKKVT